MHENPLDKALECRKSGVEFVMITVVSAKGSSPGKPGARLVVSHEVLVGTVGGGMLEKVAIDKARETLSTKEHSLITYNLDDEATEGAKSLGMACGGEVTLFFEYFKPAEKVYVWGAGHIGKLLAEMLSSLGFELILIDDRPEMKETIKAGFRIFIGDFESVNIGEVITEGSFHVVVTHAHDHDYKVLNRIFRECDNPRYVGLVSSRKKRELILGKLKSDLGEKADLSCLYTPAGIYLGGDTPTEIALSIVAEIQVVRNCIEGQKHLRDQ
ncbi:XdhC family protein [bacterium]|nr:XdhC family protein [bacterium]